MTAFANKLVFSLDLDLNGPGKAKGRPELPLRVPRVARLLALAVKLDGLVRNGAIRNFATVARLGHVSRARISQLISLLFLASDIQEEILFFPPTPTGRDPVTLRQLQPIALAPCWRRQRQLWRQLKRRARLTQSHATRTNRRSLRKTPKDFVSTK
jgi:hypothetical protein